MSEHRELTVRVAETTEELRGEGGSPSLPRLRRRLRRMTEELRLRYAKVNEETQRQPQDEWLCDNYYVLEKESKQSQRELRGMERGEDGGLCWLAELVDRVIDRELPPIDDESFAQIVSAAAECRPLSERQFSFLPCAVKIALIRQAHRGCVELGSEREISYAIVGLSKLSSVDFDSIIQGSSTVEEVLQKDPAQVYGQMTLESRRHYRYLVSRIARAQRLGEAEVARQLLDLACKQRDPVRRHIGYHILHHPTLCAPRRRKGIVALWAGALLPLLAGAGLSVLCGSWWVGALAFLPLWEILRPLWAQLALSGVDVEALPRMDLKKLDGATAPKTAVVISTLLPKAADAPNLRHRLEQLYFSNSDPNLYFCILADLKEWDFPSDEKDESQIAATRRVIEELNARYQDRFLLFLRSRTYNRAQKRYSGWERKRGAITEFIRHLKGEETSVHTFVGDAAALGRIRFLIALDADTCLLYESAQALVSAAMHPLNRPVIGKEGVVTSGYGILTPKISTDLTSAKATAFSRVLSGCGGVTAYDTKDKDFYQDLFGESIFAGKGLIDVEAFYTVLNNRFPDNQVLSHDILEGAYLRCGFVSDVEMSDQAPASMTSWLARLHRWTRGDWQNVPYLFRRVQVGGDTRDNPISSLSRYKLFDNLRRSLVPAVSLLCLVTALLLPQGRSAAVLAVCGVLAVTFSSLWAAVCSLLSGGLFTLSRKFFTRTLSHTFELMAQGFLFLVMVPVQAALTLDGALRSLWRTYISRRRLLEWTTAAQSDSRKITWWTCIRRYWPAELFGIAFLLLSLDSALCLVGVAFSLVLPVAYYTAQPTGEDRTVLSGAQRDCLVSYNAAMWRYYEDFADERNHFLPPDNVQQSPVYRVAARTSPTNIGMFLLSVLAARDLDLIDTAGLYTRVERTMDTVERLEKWNGNLYNWYDTETLELLRPAFVSAVDSGNFICCLVALAQGLREFIPQDARFRELADRVDRIVDATDLVPFYNKKKHLFSIGWDVESRELSGSHYDFLMSEARLTSYYAVARKIVDKKHWGAMGRTMSRNGSYAGPVSWTGTMFEYYMPHLLLPVYEGSLLSEALIYCLYCQKKWAKAKDIPWGISESAFYAFDNNLNYQYKAHGVQKLGVKRYLDRELVISPYSTFITIPQNPNSSMENLQRLRELGVYGRYGFFEAVDFTPGRVGTGALAVTRSYMAHHIGMSMLASCNALFDNRMQRRFMRDHYMRSAGEFLQERIAKNTVVYDEIKSGAVREERQERPRRVEEHGDIRPQAPRCALLTNGELTDILADSGQGYLKFGNIDLTRRSADLLRGSQGLLALVRAGGHTLSATQAPFFIPGVDYRVEHQEQSVTYYARGKGLELGLRNVIHPTISCVQRQLVIKNHSSKRERAQVLLYFEPVLSTWADYSAHPAYSKLFVTAKYNRDSRTLTFTRRQRDGSSSMYLTVGFLQEIPFSFETRRECLMSAPEGVWGLRDFHKKEFSDNGGGVPDACCAIRFELEVPGGAQTQSTLLIAASRSEEEGVQAVISMRKIGLLDPKAGAKSPLLADSLEGRLGCNLLGRMIFAQGGVGENAADKLANTLDQSGLWCTGVSGDLPVVLIDPAEELDRETIAGYLRLHAGLRNVNVEFDLCVLYREAVTRQMLQEELERESTSTILGARGGVFFLALDNLGQEVHTLLRAVARHIAAQEAPAPAPGQPYRPAPVRTVSPAPMPTRAELSTGGGACLEGRFYVDKTSPLPYCHVLASPVFGTLVSDKALGYTWAYNSRENKLTPWYNDICADNQGEQCILRVDGALYDLAAGSRASFSTGGGDSPADARYEGAVGELSTKVTVTVSPAGCAKYVEVELRNTGEGLREMDLAYYLEPVLGVNRDTARYVKVRRAGADALVLQNTFNLTVRSHMVLSCGRSEEQEGELGFMSDRAAFLSGNWSDEEVLPQDDPCAAVILPLRIAPGGVEHVRFVLAAGRTESGALKMAKAVPARGEEPVNRLRVSTPDEALNQMVNHFLPHQILHSRIRGRTAFYQCGGAYGFRDQLQDVAAYLLLDPQIARRQILRCCAVQFEEGDVLHWWHDLPGGVKGVRTRFSDDLLWLPMVAAEYVQKTGDRSLWEVPVRYLRADPLGEREQERYITPGHSELSGSVYEHCLRALERGCNLDDRGLPRIGCGDWNDGMSAVGIQGKGVSTWLALFLSMALERFAPVCEKRGEHDRESWCREQARSLREAVDRHCWDGDWYLRAFFDDGSPMGSKDSQECQIDLLPQSFAVLAGMPDRTRVDRGMDSAWRRLVDRDLRLVRLFDPPFQHSAQNPGYVKAYPSGLRENGGQYTHSAAWFAIALLEQGRVEQGWQVLQMLNPLQRDNRYLLEPYSIAADIYTNPNTPGRGGWSHYTGASSWYYRGVMEHLLGLRLSGDTVRFVPRLPEQWPGARLEAVLRDTSLEVEIVRAGPKERPGMTCDGKTAQTVPLDGRLHAVKVTVL